MNDLIDSLASGKMTEEDLERAVQEAQMRRKDILARYEIRPTQRGWYSYIDGKKRERVQKEDLEQLIIDFETGKACSKLPKPGIVTIENSWNSFLTVRRKRCASGTVKLDVRHMDLYIRESSIFTADVVKLTREDAYSFFQYCKDKKEGDFKRKYWLKVQATLGALWDYYHERNLLIDNIWRDLRLHKDSFDQTVPTPDEDAIFSMEEARAVKRLAIEEANRKRSSVPLGILMMFALGLRVSELCGLQWQDVLTRPSGKMFLHIQREIACEEEVGNKAVERTKSVAGDRILTLNSYCQELLKTIKKYNIECGFDVFSPTAFILPRRRKGKVTYCTISCFKSRLERYCMKAGMTVAKSNHDIRRTCLTELYDAGMPLKQLQYFAGHETPEQTLAYIRRKNDVDTTPYMVDDSDLLRVREVRSPKVG